VTALASSKAGVKASVPSFEGSLITRRS